MGFLLEFRWDFVGLLVCFSLGMCGDFMDFSWVFHWDFVGFLLDFCECLQADNVTTALLILSDTSTIGLSRNERA